HSRGAMYDRFAPSEASRILRKLEFHFTPKHASWLNMAEIELSVLARQCLSRRIADKEILKREVADWENKRNKEKCRINWKMTVDVARQKLIRHYPSISNGENTSNVLSIVLRHRVKYPLALGGASIKARHREINARFIEKLQPSADDGNAAPDTRCASIALARNRSVA
ncbi:MAG: transposase, partial [Acidobacteriota bacterium]